MTIVQSAPVAGDEAAVGMPQGTAGARRSIGLWLALAPIVGVIVPLLFWQAYVQIADVRQLVLPAPWDVIRGIADDPQFQDRMPWLPASRLGTDQVPTPIKYLDAELPMPDHAPTVGQHTDEVLRDGLGYDDTRITDLRSGGTLG